MPAAAALLDDATTDISRRLHATTDYVRFHATWKP
jgi:hypothetical protein